MEELQHFFVSFWRVVGPLELAAFITALLYSIFASYEKVWCWPFALISSALIAYINIRLHYSWQTILQVFYFGMALYGWYVWVYGDKKIEPLHITSYPPKKLGLIILAGIPFTVAFALIGQSFFHVDQPWLDGGLTAYSVIATWMMARKIIQNWLFWIIIDPLSILLYAPRERYLISLLFIIYTIIAIFGYFKWRQQLKQQLVKV